MLDVWTSYNSTVVTMVTVGKNAMTSLALWLYAAVHRATDHALFASLAEQLSWLSWVELSLVGVVGANWSLGLWFHYVGLHEHWYKMTPGTAAMMNFEKKSFI